MDYLIVDEAQFLSPTKVEQLADDVQIDVYCFGIATDQGDTVIVADTGSGVVENSTSPRKEGELATLRYQVLCRRHFWLGDLGPASPRHGQLRLT